MALRAGAWAAGDPPPGFFVSVADKGLTLAGAELAVDPSRLRASGSQRTARDSGGSRIGSGEAVIPRRKTGPGSPVGAAPSPLFSVSVADKGVTVITVRGGRCKSRCGRTSLDGSTGETNRVGLNAECAEFTEDKRRGWVPPTRGCPRVMK
jgi:hypothetical protein